MSSQPTLNHDRYLAWDRLKSAERHYRDGLIADRDLEDARDGYRPYSHPRAGDRWAQPTVAELRAQGDHGEADRIRSLQHTSARFRTEPDFDRLNPDYGVPADQLNADGAKAVRDREAALALGVRVAIHDSRQNDPDPHIWQAGQDYRAADAIQAARHQPARARHGPERTGPER